MGGITGNWPEAPLQRVYVKACGGMQVHGLGRQRTAGNLNGMWLFSETVVLTAYDVYCYGIERTLTPDMTIVDDQFAL